MGREERREQKGESKEGKAKRERAKGRGQKRQVGEKCRHHPPPPRRPSAPRPPSENRPGPLPAPSRSLLAPLSPLDRAGPAPCPRAGRRVAPRRVEGSGARGAAALFDRKRTEDTIRRLAPISADRDRDRARRGLRAGLWGGSVAAARDANDASGDLPLAHGQDARFDGARSRPSCGGPRGAPALDRAGRATRAVRSARAGRSGQAAPPLAPRGGPLRACRPACPSEERVQARARAARGGAGAPVRFRCAAGPRASAFLAARAVVLAQRSRPSERSSRPDADLRPEGPRGAPARHALVAPSRRAERRAPSRACARDARGARPPPAATWVRRRIWVCASRALRAAPASSRASAAGRSRGPARPRPARTLRRGAAPPSAASRAFRARRRACRARRGEARGGEKERARRARWASDVLRERRRRGVWGAAWPEAQVAAPWAAATCASGLAAPVAPAVPTAGLAAPVASAVAALPLLPLRPPPPARPRRRRRTRRTRTTTGGCTTSRSTRSLRLRPRFPRARPRHRTRCGSGW